MKHFLFLLTILLLTQLGFAQSVGSMAPDFTLKNVNDQQFTLSNYKGKVVAVFMLGYGCPSCRGIAPSVQSNLVDKYKSDKDFVFIGIDTWDGTTAQVQSFTTATGTNFNILQKGSQVAQAWQTTYDRMIVIDSKGNIVFKGDGLVSTHLDQAVSAIQTALENVTTAVRDFSDHSFNISLFPNPVAERLNVSFTTQKQALISARIYDTSGKIFVDLREKEVSIGENKMSIATDGLNQGLYLLQMQIGDQAIVRRFMVNNK